MHENHFKHIFRVFHRKVRIFFSDHNAKYFTIFHSGAIYLDHCGIFRPSKNISL